MKSYFFSKLCDINYRMSIHEGDANRRLASEGENILILPRNEVPKDFHTRFEELRQFIAETTKPLPTPVPRSFRRPSIRNTTAAKYIKLLKDIESTLRNR